jgi:hypothetical protein
MQTIKKYNLILVLFFLTIFSVPVIWAIRGEVTPQKSLIEGRTLKVFPSLSVNNFEKSVKQIFQGEFSKARKLFFDQFISRTYQVKVEKATADQFPGRIHAIQAAKLVDRMIIELSYLPLDDVAIPTDMHSTLYVIKDKSLIIYGPARYNKSISDIIDQRIANYQTLINLNPDINFYLFYHQRLSYSKYNPLNKFYYNPDLGQAFTYFEKNMPAKLILGKMMLSSFADHEKYYYKTDHHWNVHGALQAYDIIYGMLKQNYPKISPALIHNSFITFPGVEFLGSLDRETFYPIQAEKFEVANIDLPLFKIIEDGQEIEFNHSKEYLAGEYSTEPYVNHYGEYFGEQKALLDYVFENGSDRNLLIFGSSYTRPLHPLLAYHYHHTYIIDLRNYKDFSMSTFLSNHKVDDVLIIGDNTVAFDDLIWKINP